MSGFLNKRFSSSSIPLFSALGSGGNHKDSEISLANSSASRTPRSNSVAPNIQAKKRSNSQNNSRFSRSDWNTANSKQVQFGKVTTDYTIRDKKEGRKIVLKKDEVIIIHSFMGGWMEISVLQQSVIPLLQFVKYKEIDKEVVDCLWFSIDGPQSVKKYRIPSLYVVHVDKETVLYYLNSMKDGHHIIVAEIDREDQKILKNSDLQKPTSPKQESQELVIEETEQIIQPQETLAESVAEVQVEQKKPIETTIDISNNEGQQNEETEIIDAQPVDENLLFIKTEKAEEPKSDDTTKVEETKVLEAETFSKENIPALNLDLTQPQEKQPEVEENDEEQLVIATPKTRKQTIRTAILAKKLERANAASSVSTASSSNSAASTPAEVSTAATPANDETSSVRTDDSATSSPRSTSTPSSHSVTTPAGRRKSIFGRSGTVVNTLFGASSNTPTSTTASNSSPQAPKKKEKDSQKGIVFRFLDLSSPLTIEEQASHQIAECFLRIIRQLKFKEFIYNNPDLKDSRLRYSTMREIIETEKTYVQTLNQTISIFLAPMRTKKYVQKEDVDIIFMNIEQLREIHVELLKDMQENFSSLGQVICNHVEKFKAYVPFINGYDISMKTIDARSQTNRKFMEFFEKRYERHGCITISALLISVIQRLPRYKLLFLELLKRTPMYHVDYANIETACLKIHDMAIHVNESKRSDEFNQFLLYLIHELKQRNFGTLLAQQHRQLLKKGQLRVICQRKNLCQLCQVLVFTDCLLVIPMSDSGDFDFAKMEILFFIFTKLWETIKEINRTVSQKRTSVQLSAAIAGENGLKREASSHIIGVESVGFKMDVFMKQSHYTFSFESNDLTEIRDYYSNIQQQISQMEEKLKDKPLIQDTVSMDKKRSVLANRVQLLDSKMAKTHQEVSAVRSALAMRDKQIQQANVKINELMESIDKWNQEKEELQQEFTSLQARENEETKKRLDDLLTLQEIDTHLLSVLNNDVEAFKQIFDSLPSNITAEEYNKIVSAMTAQLQMQLQKVQKEHTPLTARSKSSPNVSHQQATTSNTNPETTLLSPRSQTVIATNNTPSLLDAADSYTTGSDRLIQKQQKQYISLPQNENAISLLPSLPKFSEFTKHSQNSSSSVDLPTRRRRGTEDGISATVATAASSSNVISAPGSASPQKPEDLAVVKKLKELSQRRYSRLEIGPVKLSEDHVKYMQKYYKDVDVSGLRRTSYNDTESILKYIEELRAQDEQKSNVAKKVRVVIRDKDDTNPYVMAAKKQLEERDLPLLRECVESLQNETEELFEEAVNPLYRLRPLDNSFVIEQEKVPYRYRSDRNKYSNGNYIIYESKPVVLKRDPIYDRSDLYSSMNIDLVPNLKTMNQVPNDVEELKLLVLQLSEQVSHWKQQYMKATIEKEAEHL